MVWRFYIQRPSTGRWLDNDATLANVELTYKLSAPNVGKASIPTGLTRNSIAEDGMPFYGKWNTLLYAEENGDLSWVGICTAANPDKNGLQLTFMGTSAWMQQVPFDGLINVWRTNVYDIVRRLIDSTLNKKPNIAYVVTNTDSAYYVGDPQPPKRPTAPARKKGQKMSDYYGTKAYKDFKKDDDAWVKAYQNAAQYSLAWYEAPYVGEEIDTLARENGFEYRERYSWKDRGNKVANFFFDLNDRFVSRRVDVAFVDGMNIAERLITKDDDDKFAQHIIGLGAGEGPGTLRVEVTDKDDRLYQAQYIFYKGIRQAARVQALAMYDLAISSSKDPKVDTVEAWDIAGFSPLSTVKVGDEVKLQSHNYDPPIDQWVRVVEILRKPREAKVTFTLEVSR